MDGKFIRTPQTYSRGSSQRKKTKAVVESSVKKGYRDSSKIVSDLNMKIMMLEEERKYLEDHSTSLMSTNRELHMELEHFLSTSKQSERALATVSDKYASELKELQEQHKKELQDVETHWKSSMKTLRANGVKSTAEIEKLSHKLEVSLSSDIQARESLESLLRFVEAASNELSTVLRSGKYIAESGSQSPESKKFTIIAVSESLRRSLAGSNVPQTLKSLFELVLQICESHISLLQVEMSEEKIVEKSVRFTQSAQKIIHSLTEELTEAATVIYQTDTFVVNLITILEKRGVIPANDVPKIFTYTEGINSRFDYSSVLPMRLDLEARNKAFTIILSGTLY